VLLQSILHTGLYTLASANIQPQIFNCDVEPFEIWHQRLAHAFSSVLQHVVSSNQLSCKSNKLGVCGSCSQAKSHKQPLLSSNTVATEPLAIVHCDLWGPSPVVANNDSRYYLLFTDQYSRFNWKYFCSNKSEVSGLFEQFKLLVQNLFSTTIKTMQIDGGTEFPPLIRANPQIQFHVSCPYTPQQNGLVERRHRHIVELSLTTMFHAHIPTQYWTDIFESVTFVINRLPSAAISFESPFQRLFKRLPDY
jgi:GAG-pre-integrase domain